MTLDFTAYHGKRKLETRENVSFIVGEGQDHDIPKGLEKALEKMKRNEKAYITIYPKYNFGARGCEKFNIPANDATTLFYDVHLKAFERAKESWQMDGDQKLEQAKLYKDKGTLFFKENKIDMAGNKYRKVIDMLEHEISLKDEKEEERKVLLQAGRMNLAMCKLKACEWIDARDLCDKVISENANVPKAYFRRGEAHIQLNDYDLAKNDFSTCLALDPSNKAAKNKVTSCSQLMKNQKDKERKTYAKMFEKFAEIDAKKERERRKMEKPLEINEWSGEGKPDIGNLKVTGDVEMNLNLDAELDNRDEDDN